MMGGMRSWRPTIHNSRMPYGLPAYDVRGSDVYPTVHHDLDPYGLPAYEIRGTRALVGPTSALAVRPSPGVLGRPPRIFGCRFRRSVANDRNGPSRDD